MRVILRIFDATHRASNLQDTNNEQQTSLFAGGNCLVFNCLRHPDKVIISDPVGAGEEMSARMSGAAGIWSEIRSGTDDNDQSDHKTQSVLASDARSEHGRRRRRRGDNAGDHEVGAWSRLLTGVSTVTQEVFTAI